MLCVCAVCVCCVCVLYVCAVCVCCVCDACVLCVRCIQGLCCMVSSLATNDEHLLRPCSSALAHSLPASSHNRLWTDFRKVSGGGLGALSLPAQMAGVCSVVMASFFFVLLLMLLEHRLRTKHQNNCTNDNFKNCIYLIFVLSCVLKIYSLSWLLRVWSSSSVLRFLCVRTSSNLLRGAHGPGASGPPCDCVQLECVPNSQRDSSTAAY